MDATTKLTVFFEDPFWVGVYQRICDGKLEAARIVFGAEPKDADVYGYFSQNWNRLKFSPPVFGVKIQEKPVNPKRMQRAAARQLSSPGAGTKAQQALHMLREQNAVERKQKSKDQREKENEHRFLLRQQKRKEKHKGR